MSLRLAWWNTGLSPRRGDRAPTEAAWAIASQVVADLFDRMNVGGLALGEVTPEDLNRLRSAVPRKLRTYQEDQPEVRIGMLYDERQMAILKAGTMTTAYAGKSLTRGLEVALALASRDTLAYLFLAHWPSRMFVEAARDRRQLGKDLRTRIDKVQNAEPSLPVVVMGDFNDEPFDQSLSEDLLGSRDRTLVRKKPELLYNPFWRWLGERQTVAEEATGRLGAGSYFYRSDRLTHWFTFDQTLVSASLLGGKGWVLCEEDTGVVQAPPLLRDGQIARGFDHFPIVATFVEEAL